MIYRESRPFETNAEYVRFVHNWCKNCLYFKLRNGYPEYPINGGCPVLDAIEIARNNDIGFFPKRDIIEEVYDDVDLVSRRICKRFELI